MALWRDLERRRSGILKPESTADRLRSARIRRLELNVEVEIKSPHRGPLTWLDVDRAEERYLLTGGADCTVAVFDLDGPGEKDSNPPDSANIGPIARRNAAAAARHRVQAKRPRPRELREVGRTPRTPLSQAGTNGQPYGGHYHSVSVVEWYPVDTGLFISGGMDGVVKLWDTNNLAVVLEFDFRQKVFTASMSKAPGQHHLVAVGNDSTQARLCDIRSGAFAHSLTGHSEAVWACRWSPRSEFLLATGSADQTARLWDIRRSGASACLISLDRDQDEADGEDEQHGFAPGQGPAGGGAGTAGAGPYRSVVEGGDRGYMKRHKLGPHFSRASKFARAHAGPVNSLCFTPGGFHLLTSGTDNRLRLWEVETGRNTMMNYLQTTNRRRRPFGMAVGQPAGRSSETVFFPNDKSGDVLAFPLHSSDGRPNGLLRAHFEPVQCCAYRPGTQEIITCGADGLAYLWSAGAAPYATRASYVSLPSAAAGGRVRGFTHGVSASGGGSGSGVGVGRTWRLGAKAEDEDEDMWSSDDEERGGGYGAGGEGGSSGGRGGGSDMARRRQEGFIPPILMQQRRAVRDRRQDDTL